jgi:uncharacterized protein with HEPN domain
VSRRFCPAFILREIVESLRPRAHTGHRRVLVWKLTNSAGGATHPLVREKRDGNRFPRRQAETRHFIRRIEIIGEAAAHLNEATRQAIPELAFRKMRGMRNIVAHDYANVDLKIVWEVATVHVPEICGVLEKFCAQQE